MLDFPPLLLPLWRPCASAGDSRTPPSALCGKIGTFLELAERRLQTRPLEKRSFVKSQSGPDSGWKHPSVQTITVTKSGAGRRCVSPSKAKWTLLLQTNSHKSSTVRYGHQDYPHLSQTLPAPSADAEPHNTRQENRNRMPFHDLEHTHTHTSMFSPSPISHKQHS